MRKNGKTPEKDLIEKIDSEARKKIKSREEGREIMFGLGVFGVVGWAVAVPTILGVALGSYLDGRFNPGFSWTLTLLFAGVILGCLNAWHWVNTKSKGD